MRCITPVSYTHLDVYKRQGILKERMAALMTDGLRAQILEANGYRTQILEFIDMAHTPKNLLIRAVYNGHCADNKAPVSYTHLDVYKRQGSVLSRRPFRLSRML